MRDFSAAELLEIRDRSVTASSIDRTLALLAHAHGITGAEVARWPVGKRDAALLEVRRNALGPTLETLAGCPACRSSVEASIAIDDLLALGRDDSGGGPYEWQGDDVTIRFRSVTSEDLLAVIRSGGNETALLERCVIDGGAAALLFGESLAAALAEADPLADITLDLQCPDCGGDWSAPLDVVSFVWTEIDAWAERVLDDVHRLALAYGWSEPAILSLSPARRAAYLERLD